MTTIIIIIMNHLLIICIIVIRWRFESAATRDHLVDANKTRNFPGPPPPQWHKRLCVQLTSAYAHYMEVNPLFSGFQSIYISKSRLYNNG